MEGARSAPGPRAGRWGVGQVGVGKSRGARRQFLLATLASPWPVGWCLSVLVSPGQENKDGDLGSLNTPVPGIPCAGHRGGTGMTVACDFPCVLDPGLIVVRWERGRMRSQIHPSLASDQWGLSSGNSPCRTRPGLWEEEGLGGAFLSPPCRWQPPGAL